MRTQILEVRDLPAPPIGRVGWPWTEGSKYLQERQFSGIELPKITIVTPSYNQERFLEETIRSVLLQSYPNLEYFVIDGGSTDQSIEIIRKYAPYLANWCAEVDRGQPHAINKGLKQATGSIMAYLNSDDVYLPGTLEFIANYFIQNPCDDCISGQIQFIDENSNLTQGFEKLFQIKHLDDWTMTEGCHIAQPATFFRAKVISAIGYFNEELRYGLDYDFWLRAFLAGYKFGLTSQILSKFRLHSSSHTISLYTKGKFDEDLIKIYQSALFDHNITQDQRQGLRRGLGIASSLLFVHLESSYGTIKARHDFYQVIQETPEVLLSKTIWPTVLVSLAPHFIRKMWRKSKNKNICISILRKLKKSICDGKI